MQDSTKKCNARLEGIPEHISKNLFVEVDMNYKTSSRKKLKLDGVKIEKNDNSNDKIYEDNVSQSLIPYKYITLLHQIFYYVLPKFDINKVNSVRVCMR